MREKGMGWVGKKKKKSSTKIKQHGRSAAALERVVEEKWEKTANSQKIGTETYLHHEIGERILKRP